jgi:hypothetical protein
VTDVTLRSMVGRDAEWQKVYNDAKSRCERKPPPAPIK